MKRLIIFLLPILISFSSLGQNVKTIKNKIVGSWTLEKHILNYNGKDTNLLIKKNTFSYSFNLNGTWKSIDSNNGKSKIISVGLWKLSSDNKKIMLYNNRFLPPNDKDGSLADHELNILKLTENEFVTNEFIYSENPPGVSYYKKIITIK